jgi:hypothetical protein
MKKLIIYSFIALLISACGDVLEEIPKDFIAPENFYKNEKDAEGAIAAVYASRFIGGSGWGGNTDNYMNFNRLHTDWSIARGSFTSLGKWDQIISTDQYGRIGGFWREFYQTINRANVVLNRVSQIEDINEDVRSRILAEAHFLRAWTYWDLLRDWGGVPIRTEEYTGASEIAVPRATKDEVYDLILSDLIIADQNLPADVGRETGRASKWAAKMLMARIYMDMENWDLAAEKASEVIESGNYSLVNVELQEDFYKIFATKTSSEDIFSHHFTVNVFPRFIQWYHGSGTPYNKGSVWGFTNLANMNAPLIVNWDQDDLRKDFNLYDRYVNTDGDTVMNDEYSRWRFKKYIMDENGNATHSIPIFRYAEAFLIYAEASAMAEGSPSGLALERLNTIRRRAYGYDPHSPSPVDFSSGMSQQEFIDTVIRERAYEFFFEDLRWWDLKRTGKAAEVISEAHDMPFNINRLLYPIPVDEMENNTAINQSDQNPGY